MDGGKYNNTNQKQVGIVKLISDKAVFKTRKFIRDKEKYYVISMGQFSRKT